MQRSKRWRSAAHQTSRTCSNTQPDRVCDGARAVGWKYFVPSDFDILSFAQWGCNRDECFVSGKRPLPPGRGGVKVSLTAAEDIDLDQPDASPPRHGRRLCGARKSGVPSSQAITASPSMRNVAPSPDDCPHKIGVKKQKNGSEKQQNGIKKQCRCRGVHLFILYHEKHASRISRRPVGRWNHCRHGSTNFGRRILLCAGNVGRSALQQSHQQLGERAFQTR